MRMEATVDGGGHGFWSHLWADSDEELVEFGDKLGLRRRWLQKGSTLHYDVVEWKRRKALQMGAIPLICGSPEWMEKIEAAMVRQRAAVAVNREPRFFSAKENKC